MGDQLRVVPRGDGAGPALTYRQGASTGHHGNSLRDARASQGRWGQIFIFRVA